MNRQPHRYEQGGTGRDRRWDIAAQYCRMWLHHIAALKAVPTKTAPVGTVLTVQSGNAGSQRHVHPKRAVPIRQAGSAPRGLALVPFTTLDRFTWGEMREQAFAYQCHTQMLIFISMTTLR